MVRRVAIFSWRSLRESSAGSLCGRGSTTQRSTLCPGSGPTTIALWTSQTSPDSAGGKGYSGVWRVSKPDPKPAHRLRVSPDCRPWLTQCLRRPRLRSQARRHSRLTQTRRSQESQARRHSRLTHSKYIHKISHSNPPSEGKSSPPPSATLKSSPLPSVVLMSSPPPSAAPSSLPSTTQVPLGILIVFDGMSWSPECYPELAPVWAPAPAPELAPVGAPAPELTPVWPPAPELAPGCSPSSPLVPASSTPLEPPSVPVPQEREGEIRNIWLFSVFKCYNRVPGASTIPGNEKKITIFNLTRIFFFFFW